MNSLWNTNMKSLIQAAVVTLFAASAAQAQQAVQWRVQDGGNGHWYVVYGGQMGMTSLNDARAGAQASGGHLITITSYAEGLFVNGLIGGYSEAVWWLGVNRGTNGQWQWDTGEPWVYTNFSYPWCTWGNQGLIAGNMNGNCWCTATDCAPPWHTASDGVWVRGAIEWSADCNNDGIVDYGQCRDGSLPDYNGNNIPDCCESGTECVLLLNVPAQYSTIQSAIDAAAPGSRVLVAPGIYYEQVNLGGKRVQLVGTGGAAQTIIDGRQQGTVITGANEPYGCVIDGFQIRNGAVEGIWSGGGGANLTNSAVTIRNCLFVGNRSMGWWGGGAIRTDGGATIVEDCVFSNNVNGDEPGGSAWHHLGGGSFVVRRCTFHDNTSNGLALGGGTGGYVMKVNPEGASCSGSIIECAFYGNHTGASTTNYWGIISLHRASQTVRIEKCKFVADRGSQPMAVFSGMDSQASVLDCQGCGFAAVLVGSGSVTNTDVSSACLDCNANGTPDLADILSGAASDANGDGIPDVCQQPTCVDADLYANGVVNGADLAALLSEWGPVTPATRADINHDGEVDGADLAFLLSVWGHCP